jgi:hypothetical protein
MEGLGGICVDWIGRGFIPGVSVVFFGYGWSSWHRWIGWFNVDILFLNDTVVIEQSCCFADVVSRHLGGYDQKCLLVTEIFI